MVAFIKFVPQQTFQECCSSMIAQGHTSRQLCTCHVVLISFHHTFACLILGKTACEDIMMCTAGYYRTLSTNDRKGWRKLKKTTDKDADYTLK
jgi:hypothetical protein